MTIGWEEASAAKFGMVRIREVYTKPVKDLERNDLEGESPDCKTAEAAKLVLGAIYKAILKDADRIWVVKFDHLNSKEANSKC